jgi:hypothetical protein
MSYGGSSGGVPGRKEQPRRSSPDEDKRTKLSEKAQQFGDSLGKQLQSRYDNWVTGRRWIEDDWLRYLRAYHGMYDPNEEAKMNPNGSRVFVQLTRMKTDSSYNRICDLMLGPEDHWDLGPSPDAELTPERREQLKQQIMQAAMVNPSMLGPAGPPTNKELDQVEEKLAAQSAEDMKIRIKDQLEAANYRKHFRFMTFEQCVLGTGVFKGPMIGVDVKQKWMRMKSMEASEDGAFQWELNEEETITPKIATPSLFDVFPDPYATETKNGIGVYERHVMIAPHLQGLKGQPMFMDEQIDRVLEMYPEGNHWENYTDIELRFVSGQNDLNEPELRYDVIEWWGWITGHELIKAGLDPEKVEPTRSYYCNVWHCGGITIKATVSPSKPVRCMYKLVPYKEVIASQYGVGVPFLMKDSQETVNAAARELINNAALSSGPQVEVAIDYLELGANEDPRDIHPWKTWLRSGGDMAYPAVRFTNVPDTTQSMAKIIEIWRAFADEETNIPSYTHGSTAMSGAAGKTASGMSMLMGAASLDIKGVVQNQDQYLVRPFIEEMYHFNMFWSDDEKIKGDMEPEAKGSSSLMAKEIKSQRGLMLLQITANPTDMAIMGPQRRAKLLRTVGKSMDYDPDDIAPDPEEVDINNEMQMNAQSLGMGPQVGPGGAGGMPGEPPPPQGSAPAGNYGLGGEAEMGAPASPAAQGGLP